MSYVSAIPRKYFQKEFLLNVFRGEASMVSIPVTFRSELRSPQAALAWWWHINMSEKDGEEHQCTKGIGDCSIR
jgi:hypothetical protein